MLDTYREVITPEGVALHLPAAGPVPRAVAWVIDLAIRLAILLLIGMLLGLLGAAGQGLYLILTFLIFWAYPILFEALWQGQTPGKKAMSLRVVSNNGAPVGWLAAITRNLLRTVDMLPFGYAAGLVACLADPYARRLGDMVAGTLVVHHERERRQAAAPVNAVFSPSVALLPS
ncbi:MAG: RDD family protein, partial [Pseudoxanthomonas sp.]